MTNGERDLPVCVDTSNKKVISLSGIYLGTRVSTVHIFVLDYLSILGSQITE